MSIDEFTTIVKTLKTVYADPKYIPNEDAVMIWYRLLKDLEYKRCSTAVATIMQTHKYPPTVAEIREEYAKHSEKRMDAMEAWGTYIVRAIRDSAYHSAERFAELPEVCKSAVGSPDTLKEWATTEDENAMSNAQARFLRSYDTASKRVYSEKQISPALLQVIEQTQALSAEKVADTKRIETVETHEIKKVSMSAETEKRIAEFLERHCI